MNVIPDEMKLCPKCGIERKRKFFSKHRTRKDGLQPECKFCQCNRYQARKAKAAARLAQPDGNGA